MSPGKLVDEKDVGCQDKSGPGKIHEVILVSYNKVQSLFIEPLRASLHGGGDPGYDRCAVSSVG